MNLRRTGESGNRGKRERLKRRMTLAGLSERLGVPARTLYRYRRSFPNQVPKNFDLESWREFIGKVRNYSADRTRPKDRNGNGTESSAEDKNGEHAEFSALAERRERILKLRLINAARRAVLERRIRSTVTLDECTQAMERIRAAFGNELLKLPASVSHELAGRNPEFIQQTLDAALRLAVRLHCLRQGNGTSRSVGVACAAPINRQSIGVGHADLPVISLTAKERYYVALPCRDFIFRDRAYIAADWEHLNNLAVEGGWRCESGSIPFLDGLLTGSQSTFRQPVPHLNRILCEQSRDSSGVALVLGLDKLHVYRFNLLAHFWIDGVLLLGDCRHYGADRQAYEG